MQFQHALFVTLLATSLAAELAPELVTYEGAGCSTEDQKYTNCPKGQGDLLSGKCVGNFGSNAQKPGAPTTMYVKMTTKDPATIKIYTDMQCATTALATYTVGTGQTALLTKGSCAEGRWTEGDDGQGCDDAQCKTEAVSMKLMSCNGAYSPGTSGNSVSGAPHGALGAGLAVAVLALAV